MTTTTKGKCPSCGADWEELDRALRSPLVWVEYPNPASHSGFLGKSDARLKAETIIAKCDQCVAEFVERAK